MYDMFDQLSKVVAPSVKITYDVPLMLGAKVLTSGSTRIVVEGDGDTTTIAYRIGSFNHRINNRWVERILDAVTPESKGTSTTQDLINDPGIYVATRSSGDLFITEGQGKKDVVLDWSADPEDSWIHTTQLSGGPEVSISFDYFGYSDFEEMMRYHLNDGAKYQKGVSIIPFHHWMGFHNDPLYDALVCVGQFEPDYYSAEQKLSYHQQTLSHALGEVLDEERARFDTDFSRELDVYDHMTPTERAKNHLKVFVHPRKEVLVPTLNEVLRTLKGKSVTGKINLNPVTEGVEKIVLYHHNAGDAFLRLDKLFSHFRNLGLIADGDVEEGGGHYNTVPMFDSVPVRTSNPFNSPLFYYRQGGSWLRTEFPPERFRGLRGHELETVVFKRD
jgi:hypothetical protein